MCFPTMLFRVEWRKISRLAPKVNKLLCFTAHCDFVANPFIHSWFRYGCDAFILRHEIYAPLASEILLHHAGWWNLPTLKRQINYHFLCRRFTDPNIMEIVWTCSLRLQGWRKKSERERRREKINVEACKKAQQRTGRHRRRKQA